MKYECTFIGSVTKDILMRVQAAPASDVRIPADMFVTTIGGVSGIAGSAFQSLGGNGAIISAVGDDDTADFIRDDFKKLNFAYSNFNVFKGEHSSTSLVQVEYNGKRCLTCYGGCVNKLTYDMVDKEVLKSSKIVHLGVLDPDVMLGICKYCKENTDALVSIDGGNISKELMDTLIPYADIYIPDDKTVKKYLDMDPIQGCRYFLDHGVKYCCVTAGPDGTYLIDNGTKYHIPVLIDVKTVDTTGAGDNYHGAVLWCLAKGWSFLDAVKFAGIFASFTTEGIGGRMSAPEKSKVMGVYEKIKGDNKLWEI